MKKGLCLITALFVFMLVSSGVSFAQKTDTSDIAQAYCKINGTIYELGEVIRKFGYSAKAVVECCKNSNSCGPGYPSFSESKRYSYDLSLIAAKYNHFEAMAYLIKNYRCHIESWPQDFDTFKDYKNYTQLMYAVKNGNVKMVEYLLKAGANRRLKNNQGQDAYALATSTDIINLLDTVQPLKKGAYPKDNSDSIIEDFLKDWDFDSGK